MADKIVLPIPNLELPQHFFTLSSPSLAHLHKNAAIQLLAGINLIVSHFFASLASYKHN